MREPDSFIAEIHDFKETNIFLDLNGKADYENAFEILCKAVEKVVKETGLKITENNKGDYRLQVEINPVSSVEIQLLVLKMNEEQEQICIDFNQLDECDKKTLLDVHAKVRDCL